MGTSNCCYHVSHRTGHPSLQCEVRKLAHVLRYPHNSSSKSWVWKGGNGPIPCQTHNSHFWTQYELRKTTKNQVNVHTPLFTCCVHSCNHLLFLLFFLLGLFQK